MKRNSFFFVIIFSLFSVFFQNKHPQMLKIQIHFQVQMQNKQVWFFIHGPHANCLLSLSIRLKHSEGKRRSPCLPWLPAEWPSMTVLKPSQSVSTKLKILLFFSLYFISESTKNSRNLLEHIFKLELNIRNYHSSIYFLACILYAGKKLLKTVNIFYLVFHVRNYQRQLPGSCVL